MNAGAGAPDSARVPIPPPIIFLAFFAAALGLDGIAPLPLEGEIVEPLGIVLALAGSVPLLWALFRFARAHVNPLPTRPVERLVLAGPYRFTRNPMYLGMLLLYVGVAMLARLSWALLLIPIVVFAVNRVVIAREEAYLTRRFGQDYVAYSARVRRWI